MGVFAGGFAILGVQKRGFWMVNRGGFVVNLWWEAWCKSASKNTPLSPDLFFGVSRFGKARATLAASHFRSEFARATTEGAVGSGGGGFGFASGGASGSAEAGGHPFA